MYTCCVQFYSSGVRREESQCERCPGQPPGPFEQSGGGRGYRDPAAREAGGSARATYPVADALAGPHRFQGFDPG